MPMYSFRAECAADVDNLNNALTASGLAATLLYYPDPVYPDINVEIETDAALDVIRSIMREVDDGHVMYQTLRAVPLAQNTLERDHHQ